MFEANSDGLKKTNKSEANAFYPKYVKHSNTTNGIKIRNSIEFTTIILGPSSYYIEPIDGNFGLFYRNLLAQTNTGSHFVRYELSAALGEVGDVFGGDINEDRYIDLEFNVDGGVI